MTARTWQAVLTVVGMLGLLTYLLALSEPADLALRQNIHGVLTDFELHTAELSRDVLLARSGLLPNYDSLARAAANLRGDLANLRSISGSAADPAARAALQDQVENLSAATREKLASLEYFKSDNALLRNSLLYLIGAQDKLNAAKPKRPTIDGALSQLAFGLLNFLQTSEASAAQEMQAVLGRLEKLAANDGEVQVLLRHGKLIVALLPEVDRSLRTLVAASPQGNTQGLEAAVRNYADRVESRARGFRVLLYLVAVALLIYLCRQFLKLRRAFRDLALANRSLEAEMAERRQAEIALQTREEQLRAITESARDAIVSFDNQGLMVTWNAGAAAIFGCPSEAMLAAPLQRVIKPHPALMVCHAPGDCHAAPTPAAFSGNLELTGIGADGQEIPLEASLARWSSQGQEYVTGILRDVSERKRLEEITRQQQLQLIQADKMATLGTLVSGVAHEINNPNQAILLNSQMLAEVWEAVLGIVDDYQQEHGGLILAGLPWPELRESVPVLARDIHGGAQRIERIVKDLKNFARPQEAGKVSEFELNTVIVSALRLLAHLIEKRTANFQRHLDADLPPLKGDPQQIEQVVINLVVNALEALSNRDAAVAIRTYREEDSGRAVLEVHDEGGGIAPEHLARLCDPFFTTKQASGGTGLGLAITASLLRAHGAELVFKSEPGQGTQALVKFPAAADAPHPDTSPAWANSEVILS